MALKALKTSKGNLCINAEGNLMLVNAGSEPGPGPGPGPVVGGDTTINYGANALVVTIDEEAGTFGATYEPLKTALQYSGSTFVYPVININYSTNGLFPLALASNIRITNNYIGYTYASITGQENLVHWPQNDDFLYGFIPQLQQISSGVIEPITYNLTNCIDIETPYIHNLWDCINFGVYLFVGFVDGMESDAQWVNIDSNSAIYKYLNDIGILNVSEWYNGLKTAYPSPMEMVGSFESIMTPSEVTVNLPNCKFIHNQLRLEYGNSRIYNFYFSSALQEFSGFSAEDSNFTLNLYLNCNSVIIPSNYNIINRSGGTCNVYVPSSLVAGYQAESKYSYANIIGHDFDE